jgi:hypothetical protein
MRSGPGRVWKMLVFSGFSGENGWSQREGSNLRPADDYWDGCHAGFTDIYLRLLGEFSSQKVNGLDYRRCAP